MKILQAFTLSLLVALTACEESSSSSDGSKKAIEPTENSVPNNDESENEEQNNENPDSEDPVTEKPSDEESKESNIFDDYYFELDRSRAIDSDTIEGTWVFVVKEIFEADSSTETYSQVSYNTSYGKTYYVIEEMEDGNYLLQNCQQPGLDPALIDKDFNKDLSYDMFTNKATYSTTEGGQVEYTQSYFEQWDMEFTNHNSTEGTKNITQVDRFPGVKDEVTSTISQNFVGIKISNATSFSPLSFGSITMDEMSINSTRHVSETTAFNINCYYIVRQEQSLTVIQDLPTGTSETVTKSTTNNIIFDYTDNSDKTHGMIYAITTIDDRPQEYGWRFVSFFDADPVSTLEINYLNNPLYSNTATVDHAYEFTKDSFTSGALTFTNDGSGLTPTPSDLTDDSSFTGSINITY